MTVSYFHQLADGLMVLWKKRNLTDPKPKITFLVVTKRLVLDLSVRLRLLKYYQASYMLLSFKPE
jgi:hypothetical protein